MLVALFFIFAVLVGYCVIQALKIDLFLEEKLAWGAVIGPVFLTLSVFFFSFIIGFSKTVIYFSFSLTALALGSVFFIARMDILQKIKEDIGIFFGRLEKGQLNIFLFMLLLTVILFGTLWPKVLYEKNQDIYTIGTAGVWGDWSAHSTYISHFVYSDKINLNNPLFADKQLSYTFMADFLSAVLMKMGVERIPAMTVPGFVFSLSFSIIFYFFILRITKRETVALLALFLFLFGGGMGFTYFFGDLKASTAGLLTFFKSSAIEYTNLNSHNIHWTSFLNTLFLPQRAMTMGLPLGILILSLVLLALEKQNSKFLIFAGILGCLLPSIHLHSLLSVCAVSFFLILFYSERKKTAYIKNFASFFLPLSLMGFWQVLLLFPSGANHLKIQLGWMAHQENWLIFWIKNLGLFFILMPFAFLMAGKKIRLALLAFLPLFLVANTVLFQPYDYDNIKILDYWFISVAAAISIIIVKLWQKNLFGKAAAIAVIPILMLSSFLDLLHLYFYPGYLLLTKNDVELAETVRSTTPANAVFLTSDMHNHFVPTLTGRQIIMGYRGWLWSYGIDYSARQEDVYAMFRGGDKAKELLSKYKVDYVVIGASEKSNFSANESFFDDNYKIAAQSQGVKIYNVNQK